MSGKQMTGKGSNGLSGRPFFKRTDKNQPQIVEALRKMGAFVWSIAAAGRGVPDLLVLFRGKTYLMEVKGKSGKLTPQQEQFFSAWLGSGCNVPCLVVRSPTEAISAIGGT